MGPVDLTRRDELGVDIPNREEIVSRYKQVRAISSRLGNEMVKRLSTDALKEGARKLGMMHQGVMVFNSEAETSVLMDYCVYDVRRNGRNAVEQYLLDSPPDPQSDEMLCLQCMQQARYCLFMVESALPGLGVMVRDVLTQETILIADIGFGNTAKPGVFVASRLVFHEGFATTGGAALAIGMPPEEDRPAVTAALVRAAAADGMECFDPAPLIRACRGRDSSPQIQYRDPTEGPVDYNEPEESVRSSKVGRNSPCPCGSGRKFKHCCMNKRIGPK